MPFEFERQAIEDVILIKPKVFADDRGYFMESFKHSDFKANGIDFDFLQDNHSLSSKGVFRGLHYQLPPHEQGKLVRVATGRILDVAVDIRKGSPTFGQHVSAELSAENHHCLWVPPGFAHGVLVLEDDTHLLYRVTKEFSSENDCTIRFDDPAIGIDWPDKNPLLSERDTHAPLLADANNPFIYGENC
jgi:dTDP-4-dehydrorhamnose 3,5-epimerase